MQKTAPKTVFLLVLIGFFGLMLLDHLTSPSLSSVSAPAALGNGCAPCGAPCKPE
jgi:hypothetical protein